MVVSILGQFKPDRSAPDPGERGRQGRPTGAGKGMRTPGSVRI